MGAATRRNPGSVVRDISDALERQPSHSVTSWAKLVSWPCPDDIVPITSSTWPSGSMVISVRSRGRR